jgi:hypothetical protein
MSKLFLAAVKYCSVLQSGHKAHIVVDCVGPPTRAKAVHYFDGTSFAG